MSTMCNIPTTNINMWFFPYQHHLSFVTVSMLFPFLTVPVYVWRSLVMALVLCAGLSLAMAVCTKKRKKPQSSYSEQQDSNEDTTNRQDLYGVPASKKKGKTGGRSKTKDKGGKPDYKEPNDQLYMTLAGLDNKVCSIFDRNYACCTYVLGCL